MYTIQRTYDEPGAEKPSMGPSGNFFRSVLTAGLLFASSGAHALLIDHFNQSVGSTQVRTRTTNGVLSSQVGTNIGIIGPGSTDALPVAGWRDMILQRTAGTSGRPATAAAGDTSPTLVINNDTGVVSNVTLVWDGNDAAGTTRQIGLRTTGAGARGVDLTDGGLSEGFLVDIIDIDLNVTMEFTVYSGRSGVTANATGASILSRTITNINAVEFFAFSDFTTLGGFTSGADFTNVGAIVLKLSGPASWDAELDFIRTGPRPIPEPTIPMLLGLGLTGLVWLRRKRMS